MIYSHFFVLIFKVYEVNIFFVIRFYIRKFFSILTYLRDMSKFFKLFYYACKSVA